MYHGWHPARSLYSNLLAEKVLRGIAQQKMTGPGCQNTETTDGRMQQLLVIWLMEGYNQAGSSLHSSYDQVV